MKKISNLSFITILTLIWLILNESVTPLLIVIGILLSIASISFANHYLLDDHDITSYNMKFSVLIKYYLYLVFEIYKSGMIAIGTILKGNNEVRLIEYTSCLQEDLSISFLANAITLTPGTVTVDKKGNVLTVLCFRSNKEIDVFAEGMVCSKFEQILKG